MSEMISLRMIQQKAPSCLFLLGRHVAHLEARWRTAFSAERATSFRLRISLASQAGMAPGILNARRQNAPESLLGNEGDTLFFGIGDLKGMKLLEDGPSSGDD